MPSLAYGDGILHGRCLVALHTLSLPAAMPTAARAQRLTINHTPRRLRSACTLPEIHSVDLWPGRVTERNAMYP